MVGQPEAESALTNYESKKVGWSSKVAAAVPSNQKKESSLRKRQMDLHHIETENKEQEVDEGNLAEFKPSFSYYTQLIVEQFESH